MLQNYAIYCFPPLHTRAQNNRGGAVIFPWNVTRDRLTMRGIDSLKLTMIKNARDGPCIWWYNICSVFVWCDDCWQSYCMIVNDYWLLYCKQYFGKWKETLSMKPSTSYHFDVVMRLCSTGESLLAKCTRFFLFKKCMRWLWLHIEIWKNLYKTH